MQLFQVIFCSPDPLQAGACMRIHSLLLIAISCCASYGKDFPVATLNELTSALELAKPGDSLSLREGEWIDANIVFEAAGSEIAPITLRAATPGKTLLTGASRLRIAGSHLIVEGLRFRDPDPSISDLIEFRKDSKRPSENCRLTNCSVEGTRSRLPTQESRWIGLYGQGHRVDHCEFTGKSGKGATFVVWLDGQDIGKHQIDHNYFGPREQLGTNGGETIRIGDSKTSMRPAGCIVEYNLFESCNGEAECISNKSCGNIYRDNMFLKVSGTLTLRHGNGCLVERNVFLGEDAPGTGGIRIIGEDHVVRENYLEKLTGDDARSAITLMMGIPNSPANRYFQVQRVKIENNTIVACEHSILIGLSDDKLASLVPIETVFFGNQVFNPKHPLMEVRCALSGIEWRENSFHGESLGISEVPTGIAFETSNSANEPSGLNRPTPIARDTVGPGWE